MVRYGFDYLEPPAAAIAEMDEPAFRAFKSAVVASPIRCECFNSFIRKLRVVGDDVHRADLEAYLESTLERCRQLGASVVVRGSAGSRNVEEGYSRSRAWEQIRSFLRKAGDIARPKGIVIAIEPLRRKESNILDTGAEALRMVREAHHPYVKVTIDYFHLREENEDPEIIWRARKQIVHFHFANPHGRVWPIQPQKTPTTQGFLVSLKESNSAAESPLRHEDLSSTTRPPAWLSSAGNLHESGPGRKRICRLISIRQDANS